MTSKKLTKDEVLHIAQLCDLKLTEDEVSKLSVMLFETISYIKILEELDTKNTSETYQVTGLTNVFQDSNVEANTLTQKQALSNAKEVQKNMFTAKAVFER